MTEGKHPLQSITIVDIFFFLWKFLVALFLVCLILAVPIGVIGALVQQSNDRQAAAEAAREAEIRTALTYKPPTQTQPALSHPPGAIPLTLTPDEAYRLREVPKRRKQKSSSACMSPDGYVNCGTGKLLP